MALPKVVADWDHTKGEPLRISGAEYVLWSPDEVDDFNAWLLEKRRDNSFKVGRLGDTFLIDAGVGHVFSGAPADRDPTTAGAADGGPFRRRTRDLGPMDVGRLDGLYEKANELHQMFNDILGRRAEVPGAPRDIALAKTHLEDSVMRAVRALTA